MHPGLVCLYKLMSHLIIHVFTVCHEQGFNSKYWDLWMHWFRSNVNMPMNFKVARKHEISWISKLMFFDGVYCIGSIYNFADKLCNTAPSLATGLSPPVIRATWKGSCFIRHLPWCSNDFIQTKKGIINHCFLCLVHKWTCRCYLCCVMFYNMFVIF